MDTADPHRDQQWNSLVRSETAIQRLDRNWNNLLQELRVVQTGVQLLTGFLLTLPFQQRFDMLTGPMRALYLVTVASSVASTMLLVAPVGMHRLLFHRHKLEVLVSTAHRFAFIGLLLLGLALVGATALIFDTVAGHGAGIAAGVCALIALTGLWIVLPLRDRSAGTGTS
ncbi:MAG: hypothetical protein K2Q25_04965 [Mycobacteriaceae bacterium]|nr:hypothetical protein [Mycobacteriaceae bacterium]